MEDAIENVVDVLELFVEVEGALDLATTERAQAEKLAADVADKVLANPVIESYRIEVD